MNRTRTLAACLASTEAAMKGFGANVAPIRPPVPLAGSYGSFCSMSPLFVEGRNNACPACNARSWTVGRITAECAGCGTVLPIVQPINRKERTQ